MVLLVTLVLCIVTETKIENETIFIYLFLVCNCPKQYELDLKENKCLTSICIHASVLVVYARCPTLFPIVNYRNVTPHLINLQYLFYLSWYKSIQQGQSYNTVNLD